MRRNFWIEPPHRRRRGLTDDELDAHERRIGFALPAQWRALLRRQNGGATRFTRLPGADDVVVDHLTSVPAADETVPLLTLEQYLLATMSPAEILELQRSVPSSAPLHPARLILLSGLDGHSVAALDYGYRDVVVRDAPRVVFIGDDAGDDVLPFGEIGPAYADFDAFIAALRANEALEHFIGIDTDVAFDDLAAAIAAAFDVAFTRETNDRFGHYDFDSWRVGRVSLDVVEDEAPTTASTHVILSPNRHRSGARLFNDEEMTAVLEVHRCEVDPTLVLAAIDERLRAIPGVRRIWRLT